MYKVAHIPMKELNRLLTCAICKGYLVDATTVVECLHSFCKTCIVTHLQYCNTCPVCDTLLHKTRPQYAIRSDHVLQAIVYKLVPKLLENEMNLRKEFYSSRPLSELRSLSPEKRGDITLNAYVHKEDERLSIELSYKLTNTNKTTLPPSPDLVGGHTTYLLCPPGLTVGHLEKLIRLKFELKPEIHQVSIFFSPDDAFTSDYTLTDLACLCSWVRQRPLRLFFSVSTIYSDSSSTNTNKNLRIDENTEIDKSRRLSSNNGIPLPALSSTPPSSNGSRILLTNGWA